MTEELACAAVSSFVPAGLAFVCSPVLDEESATVRLLALGTNTDALVPLVGIDTAVSVPTDDSRRDIELAIIAA